MGASRRWRVAVFGALVALPLAACNVPPAGRAGPPSIAVASPAASPGGSGGSGSGDAAARQYCTDQGGMLVDRHAVWNTNADPQAWLELAGEMTFCEFESGTGDETTRISVDLVTLSSTEPTLAAIAYLSKVPPTLPEVPSANPAEVNCREGLGGTSSFGNGAAGGGWVNESEPVFNVMNLCVFPDMSAIDAFGILYYSQGTVRGADLATKMRYQPGNRLPAIFGN